VNLHIEMILRKYPNRHAKRTHKRARLSSEEFDRLFAISDEWELVKVDEEGALFKPKKP